MNLSGGFGSSDTDYSSSSTNNPPSWTLPGYPIAGNDLISLYLKGKGGPAMLNRSHVADLSDLTKSGIGSLFQAGGSWSGFDPQYLDSLTGVADYYQPMASGEYLKQGNPYYLDRLKQNVDESNDLIRSAVDGQGRYGSSYLGDTLRRNTSDMMSQGLENDWNREADRQMQAIAGLGNIFGTAAGLEGQYANQDYQNRLLGAGAQLQAGGMLDQNAQAKLDDLVQRRTQKKNQDWIRLAMFLQGLSGASGPYGTSDTTGQSSTDQSQFGFGLGK